MAAMQVTAARLGFRLWQGVSFIMLAGFLWVGGFNQFLVAPDYQRAALPWELPAVFAFAALGAWLNMVAGYNKRSRHEAMVAGFLVSAMFLWVTLFHTWPMAWTRLAGHEGTMRVTILDPQAAPVKGCRRGRVTIEGALPLFGSEICNMPDRVRRRLSSGDPVRVLGMASDLGIYYRDFQMINGE